MASKAKAKSAIAAKESATTKDFHIEAGRTDALPLGRGLLTFGQIEADPNNPRKHFDDAAIDLMAESVAREGLLQDLLIRRIIPEGDGPVIYRLVAGERRWRGIGRAIAKKLLPADWAIKVEIRELSDEQASFLALMENMARKDLLPLEEARHFKHLIADLGQTTASIAKKTGFTQRFVQQRLQLLELKASDAEDLAEGRINIEEARRRIASYPKPFDFAAPQRVLILELLKFTFGKEGRPVFYNWIKIDYRHGDAVTAGIAKLGLIMFTTDWKTQDAEVYLQHAMYRAAEELTGSREPKMEQIDAPLRLARIEALGGGDEGTAKTDVLEAEGRYLVNWLNPPFEIDPERIAAAVKEVETRKAHEVANNARMKAEKDAKAASHKAFNKLRSDIKATDPEPIHADLQAAFLAAGVKLPLAVKDDAVVDADGARLICTAYGGSNVDKTQLLRLLILASDAAMGFPTKPPAREPEPPPAGDEANAVRDDADEPELTPAMLALAGVKTAPAAEPAGA